MATLISDTRRSRFARRFATSERGAEVVELAIVTPVLLLLIMGIVDFGLLFQRYAVLNNAAMEGARVGTLPGYNVPDDVVARVQAYAESGGIPIGTVAVEAIPTTVPAPAGGAWPAVQVTVSHDYTLEYTGGLASVFFGGTTHTVTLRARAVMRNQIGG